MSPPRSSSPRSEPSRGGRPTKTRCRSPRSIDGHVVLAAVDPEAAPELVHRDVRPALDESPELGRRAAGHLSRSGRRRDPARDVAPDRRCAVRRCAVRRWSARAARGQRRGARHSSLATARPPLLRRPGRCATPRPWTRRRRLGTRRGDGPQSRSLPAVRSLRGLARRRAMDRPAARLRSGGASGSTHRPRRARHAPAGSDRPAQRARSNDAAGCRGAAGSSAADAPAASRCDDRDGGAEAPREERGHRNFSLRAGRTGPSSVDDTAPRWLGPKATGRGAGRWVPDRDQPLTTRSSRGSLLSTIGPSAPHTTMSSIRAP